MESDLLVTLKSILEMGWPAIVLIELWLVWRDSRQERTSAREAYSGLMKEYIETLKEVAGMRNTLSPVNPLPQTTPELKGAPAWSAIDAPAANNNHAEVK